MSGHSQEKHSDMRMTTYKVVGIIVATIIGAAILNGILAAIAASSRNSRANKLTQQYRTTSRRIRRQLTTAVLNDLCCQVNASPPSGPGELLLPPKEAEQARTLLTSILDYSEFLPCSALRQENTIAPNCWLFFSRGNDKPDQCLVAIEIYEAPYAAIITSPALPKEPPIIIELDHQLYGDYRELMGALKCAKGRKPAMGK
jgi:hypothetical protein